MKTLAQRRVLHAGMGGILQVAVNFYDEWQRCRAACKESTVYETRSREGTIIWKSKPEVSIGNQARKGLMACLQDLGLTPAPCQRPRRKKRAGSSPTSRIPRSLRPEAGALSDAVDGLVTVAQ